MADEDPKLTDEQAELSAMFGKKKKKTKASKGAASEPAVTDEPASALVPETSSGNTENIPLPQPEMATKPISSIIDELDPPPYTYDQLLERVVGFVHQNNPELIDKKRSIMKPPQLSRGNFLINLFSFDYQLFPLFISWNEENIVDKFSRNLFTYEKKS
jgi:hypothetical protein